MFSPPLSPFQSFPFFLFPLPFFLGVGFEPRASSILGQVLSHLSYPLSSFLLPVKIITTVFLTDGLGSRLLVGQSYDCEKNSSLK